MIHPGRVRRRLALTALTATAALGLGALPAWADSHHLTDTAKAAGLQPGNAHMGWREGTDSADPAIPPVSPKTTDNDAGNSGVDPAPAAAPRKLSAQRASVPTGVLGIDVSSYQKTVDWASWAAQGKQFAYVKATEGTSYKNPYFSSQYDGAAKAGLIRGAYHFANPAGKSGKKQARYFVDHGGAWKADGKTLPGVLDIEYNPHGSTCYGVSKTKMKDWISSFTKEYKKRTGREAIIYTTTDWWTRCTGNTTRFSDTNPLWIARYGTSTPGTLPGTWSWATFWQYTSTPLDQDVFDSTYDQLVVLASNDS